MGLIAKLAVVLAANGAVAPPVVPPSPESTPPAAPKAEILGVWKGRSTCVKVEGNEFCRDETVVYNVVDVKDQPQTVGLKAARIIDESVQPMYELFFTYRPETGSWLSEFTRPKFRGLWTYVVHGDELTGTATLLPSLTVVRSVSAKREPQEPVAAH